MTNMANTQQPLVLVVDDEAPIRQVERRILEQGGYRVQEAAGAAEAFAMLEEGLAPDLLIADLDMPEISGEAMVSRVHAARPHLKVLYVTGNIDRLLNARSLIWEGEAFLDKPFTTKGLLEAVSLLITGSIGARPEPPHHK
jgi:two-component system cell cycle sensor histidine kinase/response regulator CckA